MNQPIPRRRRLALTVLCVASLMVVLDSTVVAVALPAIQSGLGFSPGSLAWVVNSYLVAFAGLLLLSGRLGDLVGRRRVFLAGLALFTVASLLCGLAPTPFTLVAARFAQGVGGALASAMVLGMIVTMYPGRTERARALGVFSFVQAAGASLGLVAGGVLTDVLGWHWVFFVNVPIGVAALAVTVRVFPAESGPGLRRGADVTGAALVTAALMLLVYAIVFGQAHGWGDPATPALLVGALVLLAGFVVRQARAATPLLPLRIFRSRAVSGTNGAMVVIVAGMIGFQFLAALYLEQALGLSPLATGLVFLPTPIAIAVVSLTAAPRLVARFGARAVLTTGLAMNTVAMAALTTAPSHGGFLAVMPELVVLGIGMGAVVPAIMGQAMSGATAADSGVASGLANTTQQVGGALGTAVLTTVAASRTATLRAAGHDPVTALTGGFHVAYATSAGFLLAGLVVTLAVLRPARHAAAEPDPAPEAAVGG